MARPAPGADRSVAVLELLAGHPDERFTLSEVARRCQLNKATAHALLSALAERGVLLRHPDEKRYSLGPRLVTIGDAARRGYSAIDFAPRVLAALSQETGLWARAWRESGDLVACVSQVGPPVGSPGGSPARMPMVPPVGVLFMAWSDAPTVEAWLARAPASEAVPPTLEALPAIRRRRFSVMLSSPDWRRLSGSAPVTGEVADGDNASPGRSLLVAVARQALLVPEIDDDRSYLAADVAAPVFDAAGEVVLTVSVTLPDDQTMAGARLRALGERIVAVADDLTAAVRGRRP